ncbi:MAG TPA: thioesterase family protein [Blastocatellia bacterium]|nr:thioesterase family protein [Blastocatellia bacterium]
MFETRLQTYWDDADPAGLVYFANFFRFAEYAETELFRSAGKERMKLYEECSIWMPRVETFAKFKKPIYAEQAVFVRLGTRFIGEKTVRMEFELLNEKNRERLAEGYIIAVCIDRASYKARPLPPAMREVFERAAVDGQEST